MRRAAVFCLGRPRPGDKTPVCADQVFTLRWWKPCQPLVTMAEWDNSPPRWFENDLFKHPARMGHCTLPMVCVWSQRHRRGGADGVWSTSSVLHYCVSVYAPNNVVSYVVCSIHIRDLRTLKSWPVLEKRVHIALKPTPCRLTRAFRANPH